jgi:hypothetical protein
MKFRGVLVLFFLISFVLSINLNLLAAERKFDFKINNISNLAEKKKELEKKKKLSDKEKAKLEKKQKKEEARKAKLEAKKQAKLEKKRRKEEARRAKMQGRKSSTAPIVEKKRLKKENRNFKEVKVIKKKTKKIKFPGLAVYKDAGFKGNNYIPTGWMGDIGDLRMSSRYFVKPKKGMSCIKIGYSARQTQGNGWAGIYWQNPANNWGDENKGFNLVGAKKLKFYIKGEKGGEVIDVLKMGGITGVYPDTADVSFGPIMLTKRWKKYEIDLRGYDLSHIIGGFCFVVTAESNPDGIIFYIDEIQYK